METLFYILSISLEVAGAGLVASIKADRDQIIRLFVGGYHVFKNNNTNKLEYNTSTYEKNFCDAHLNRIAFIYIAASYILGIFGQNQISTICAAVLCILGSVAMILTTKHIVELYYRNNKGKLEFKNEDLQRLHLEPTSQNISDEDWNNFWK